jgi:hypothetical protein
VSHHPHGALFDVLLLLHVVAALVALAAVVASAVAAARLVRTGGGAAPAGVRRYFAPGTNWAGRALHAVPLLGLALVGSSGGAFGFGDTWVLTGIGLWAAAAALAEGVVWRVERRVGAALVDGDDALPDARRLCGAALVVLALLVAAFAVMIVQP